MPTPEEIFMQAFADEFEEQTAQEAPEMPVLSKLAANLGLTKEDDGAEEIEMPIFDKLAANVEGAEQEAPEIDFEGMTQLEKLAFTKWAQRNGLTKEALSMTDVKEKGKSLVEKGKSALKGKEWTGAEKKLQEAQGKRKPLLFGRGKHKANIAAAEKGVAAAKGKRMGLGKKIGVGAGAAGAAVLTAAAVRKALGGRKKKKEE
jgi:hypothetical protein